MRGLILKGEEGDWPLSLMGEEGGSLAPGREKGRRIRASKGVNSKVSPLVTAFITATTVKSPSVRKLEHTPRSATLAENLVQ